ncbi:hypothetical protein [Pimelobacter sp. 30-1]|uniref:hypothetical protein n=1 Tax=Pimelobacter sp. 30-1 TaxID=2004991 RepID=UPI001C05A38D|nr:hypothetical protein [Pimelobacter sp. 30-1]MBU2695098.1 hypothetical protein [Pimelobacter sp. 30-1]
MRTVRAVLAALATAAALVATSIPAQAATTYTPSGGAALRLVGTGITITDIPAGQVFNCTASTLDGPVASAGTSRAYGAATAALTSTTGPCTNAVVGPTTVTQLSTWSLAVAGDELVPGRWPARIDGVRLRMRGGSVCDLTLEGTVEGTFDEGTQRFTPATGASGLVITAVSGNLCALTLDMRVGDEIEVGGYWTNVPPAGSAPLALANP